MNIADTYKQYLDLLMTFVNNFQFVYIEYSCNIYVNFKISSVINSVYSGPKNFSYKLSGKHLCLVWYLGRATILPSLKILDYPENVCKAQTLLLIYPKW